MTKAIKKNANNSSVAIWIVTFIILYSIDFWSYMPYLLFVDYRFVVAVIGIAGTFVLSTRSRKLRTSEIDRVVIWYIITILCCLIPSHFTYNQPAISELICAFPLLYGFVLYFGMRNVSLSSDKVLKIIIIISSIWVFLELIQQLTFPNFWFSGRFLWFHEIERRLGFYRFYIFGIDFVLIAYCYLCQRITASTKNKDYTKDLLLFIFIAVGILCYCSRKHIVVEIFAIFFCLLAKRGTNKFINIIFALGVLYAIYDMFSSQLIEMNEQAMASQGQGEDFIRYIAAQYFISDFSNSPLYPIFGAGLPTGGSVLSKKISEAVDMGLYQSDIGIIGYYSQFGFVGISAIVFYIVVFIKNWSKIDVWLKCFFLIKLLLMLFDFWGMWQSGMTANAIFLYLLHRNIRKNQMQAPQKKVKKTKKKSKRLALAGQVMSN